MNFPIIGEPLSASEEEEAKKDVEFLENSGMSVKKIINYKDGSMKFIADFVPKKDQYRIRKTIEESGWKVGTPYYLNGMIHGFRVSREGPASRINVWGGT